MPRLPHFLIFQCSIGGQEVEPDDVEATPLQGTRYTFEMLSSIRLRG